MCAKDLDRWCFEVCAGHVFICSNGAQCNLMQVNNMSFVETGKICEILHLVCKKVSYRGNTIASKCQGKLYFSKNFLTIIMFFFEYQ